MESSSAQNLANLAQFAGLGHADHLFGRKPVNERAVGRLRNFNRERRLAYQNANAIM
jgi:hypothetical protein